MKLSPGMHPKMNHLVAPLVGAWIEINLIASFNGMQTVAPLVGAWIEINTICIIPYALATVAPLVGAWIEIESWKHKP